MNQTANLIKRKIIYLSKSPPAQFQIKNLLKEILHCQHCKPNRVCSLSELKGFKTNLLNNLIRCFLKLIILKHLTLKVKIVYAIFKPILMMNMECQNIRNQKIKDLNL